MVSANSRYIEEQQEQQQVDKRVERGVVGLRGSDPVITLWLYPELKD